VKPGAWWPLAIIGVLAVTVGANVALLLAARDPNAYVVEPDYYHKAVNWDSTMAQARASVALGWRVDAAFGAWTPSGTPLLVQLSDSTGAPLTGVELQVELINNLSPETPVRVAPAESARGRYGASVALARPGLWELRLQARRAGAYYTADLHRDVARGATP
jgi:nitrogen fixation protein FixH